jgi:surface antigen
MTLQQDRGEQDLGPCLRLAKRVFVIGGILSASLSSLSTPTDAARTNANWPLSAEKAATYKAQAQSTGHSNGKLASSKNGKTRYAANRLQCVPFARAASGIELKGNAVNWWDAAAGVYERGSRPEAGSVLNFRSIGSMRLGHVAVVTNVVNSREIEIDHANWTHFGAGKGGVSRGVHAIDVSEGNDWSRVRVALGRDGDYGSVYLTFGFIYNRSDRGVMVANTLANTGRTNSHFDETVFADEDSPAAMVGAFEALSTLWLDEPKVADAFRSGKGVAWHDHSACLFRGTERFFRPGYNANLVSSWLPALDGVIEKLQAGARVADVGCGHGASRSSWRAFPNSHFTGFDYHAASIDRARRAAEEAGVASNTQFEVAGFAGTGGWARSGGSGR